MNQPLLVTAAIIEREGKFLLIKRGRKPFAGEWCFIGGCGFFEAVKNPIDVVREEVSHDINCEFKPVFFDYNYEDFGCPSVVLYFSGDIVGEPDISGRSILEIGWFDKEEVLKMDMGFDHKRVFERFIVS